MNILLVGAGGREHALAWAVHRDDPGVRLYAAPGNPGMASVAALLPIAADDIAGIEIAALELGIHLVIVGPEVPLALGLADRLRARGIPVFGPSAAAARIESSKSFAKGLMERAGVPTAASRTFTDLDAALAYVGQHEEPLVVKASGLAAGKGAVVCSTRDEAGQALRTMMADRSLGEAGAEVVVEEFMEGEELSVFALTNGRDFFLLPPAQDHKRLGERDVGPNTGGMGAYSPVSLATPELLRSVGATIITPTLEAMEREGARFNGLLYAGLMIDRDGRPRVVEFNCRFGDPETQAILPLLEPGLLEALRQVANNQAPSPVETSGRCAVTTVLAARGYPDQPEKGALIQLPPHGDPDIHLFHAGTARNQEGNLVVAGGRVFGVTGTGTTFAEAQARSRQGALAVRFDGKVFRGDIGWREAERAGTPGG